jgi:hypothetical protein
MFCTNNVRFLLVAIWLETQEVLHRPLPGEGKVARCELARLKAERDWLGSLGVRWDVSKWLGRHATHCEISRFSQTTQRMERAGLLQRSSHTGGTRMTHVRLTLEGEHLAQELVAGGIGCRIAKRGVIRRIDPRPGDFSHLVSGMELRRPNGDGDPLSRRDVPIAGARQMHSFPHV